MPDQKSRKGNSHTGSGQSSRANRPLLEVDHATATKDIGKLLDIMAAHMDNAQIQEAGGRAFGKLMRTSSDAELVAAKKQQVVASFLESMKSHQASLPVQEVGSYAFHLMSFTDILRDQVGNAAVVNAVVSAMHAWKDERNLQNMCLCFLANLGSYKEYSHLIVYKECILAVTGAMEKHRKDYTIQEKGMITLSNMASFGQGALVVENGGITEAVRAMAAHRGKDTVMMRGCYTLTYMLRCPESARLFLNQNGVGSIISAAQRHVTVPDVQNEACNLIGHICTQGFTRQVLDEGALDTVITAMKTHQDAHLVQVSGCGAMMHFAKSERDIGQVVKEGGLKLVMQAVTLHQDKWDVSTNGFYALEAFAAHEEYARWTAKEGGIKYACAAMRKFGTESNLAVAVGGYLSCLSAFEGFALELRTGDALPCMLQAMSRFVSISRLQLRCFNFIDFTHLECRDGFPHNKLLAYTVLASCRHNLREKGFQEPVCQTLRHLTRTTECIPHLMNGGVMPLLLEIMKSNKDHSWALTGVCKIVRSIVRHSPEMAAEAARQGALEPLHRAAIAVQKIDGWEQISLLQNDMKDFVECQHLLEQALHGSARPSTAAGGETQETSASTSTSSSSAAAAAAASSSSVPLSEDRSRKKDTLTCAVCAKTAADVGRDRLLKCAACSIQPLYCSAECQRNAWKKHKHQCKANPKHAKCEDDVV